MSRLTPGRARVLSNYARLMVTFVTGFLVIRLLAEIGPSALVVYLLIAAGTGFAQFFKIVIQESVIPVLGLSHDEGLGRSFASVYWIALLASLVAGGFALAIFAVIWILRGSFDTGALGPVAFGVALGTGALRVVISALATPALNGILVAGRVVPYNGLLAAERLVDLVAVLLVPLLWAGAGEEAQAIGFFALSAGLYALVQGVSFAFAIRLDKRYIPRPAPVSRDDLGWVGGIFGWNIALVVAFILYLRLSTFVVNASFGEAETLVLGLVFLLIGYQRQIAMGLVIGLDAMMSRLIGAGRGTGAAAQMVLRATWVQAVFSFFSVVALVLFARPIFELWLGASLAGTGWDLDWTVELFSIMAIGVLARSLSESWMKFLGGKGRVGAYAPVILAGGLVNAGVLGAVAMVGWDGRSALAVIAWSYATLHLIVHMGVLPWITLRELDLPRARFFAALAVPGVAAGVVWLLGRMVLGASPGPGASLAVLGLIALVALGLLLPNVALRVIGKPRPEAETHD